MLGGALSASSDYWYLLTEVVFFHRRAPKKALVVRILVSKRIMCSLSEVFGSGSLLLPVTLLFFLSILRVFSFLQ